MNASTSTQRDDMVTMRFLFQVSDVEHVDDIIAELYDVDGVFEARRMKPGESVGRRDSN